MTEIYFELQDKAWCWSVLPTVTLCFWMPCLNKAISTNAVSYLHAKMKLFCHNLIKKCDS